MISPEALRALEARAHGDEWAGVWITVPCPEGMARCNIATNEPDPDEPMQCAGYLGHTSAHVVYWGDEEEFGFAWNNHGTEVLYVP